MRCHRVLVRFPGPLEDDRHGWPHALGGVVFAAPRAWRPAADVWEGESAWLVRLDLPGTDDDDVSVVVHPDALVVEGERRAAIPPGARCHVAELRPGPFRFAMRFPAEIDPGAADARLDRGVLEVRLPRRGPRKIEVTS